MGLGPLQASLTHQIQSQSDSDSVRNSVRCMEHERAGRSEGHRARGRAALAPRRGREGYGWVTAQMRGKVAAFVREEEVHGGED